MPIKPSKSSKSIKKPLEPSRLRVHINPDTLGFEDTSELINAPLSWIGQERAEVAAHFGLAMKQPDYHLFVLGEVGSGRSSLLHQAMIATAAKNTVPPDLCYLNNFNTPEKPVTLRPPAGQGRILRELLAQLVKTLPDEISLCLNGQDFKIKQEQLLEKFKAQESKCYAVLDAFAEARHFSIRRESGQIVFTLLDHKGKLLTEDNLFKLSKSRRAEIDLAEQELHAAIIQYFDEMKTIENEKSSALATLQRDIVRPLLDHKLAKLSSSLHKQLRDNPFFKVFIDQIITNILDNLTSFESHSNNAEKQHSTLEQILARYQVNLVVDNHHLQGAPVIVEDNPVMHNLFGSIDYQYEDGKIKTDFMHIRAGSLHKAHGGFILLHLSDLLTDPLVWGRLRRMLRSNRLHIEEPATALTTTSMPMTIEPEAVDLDVKIVLIGSREEYYILQAEDPEFIRRFRVKVDFADSFKSSPDTYRASSIFVAHTCNNKQLPHFSAAAVAYLLEESHREVDDQTRQSAIFARTEMLIVESAALCHARGSQLVETNDLLSALQARTLRHNYPDQWLQEAIIDNEILVDLHGTETGQLNAITQIDMGDHCFGTPIRVTARTFAGEDGLLNIAHEVNMSGPIHDKGVFILQNYLSALFAHLAPLALSASIVFEQEYTGIEGDSASCAEFFALLSSLSQLPVKQSIAVTGAMNQYGEVLPVGGINDKIEGFFNICEKTGLNGEQGVLIPYHNARHLVLSHPIIQAVEDSMFQIYVMKHVTEGLELLTGIPSGIDKKKKQKKYPAKTVLGLTERTLIDFRHACQTSHSRPES